MCERAEAAGISEAELDAELAAIRREQLSTLSLLRAVADIGRERERTARRRGHDTGRLQLAWATSADVAARLGVDARQDVQPLVDHALDTGLLYRVRETATFGPLGDEAVGWALTPAGSRCVEAGDLRAQPRRSADAR